MVAVISKKKTNNRTNEKKKLFAIRFRKPTKQFGKPADLLFNKHD